MHILMLQRLQKPFEKKVKQFGFSQRPRRSGNCRNLFLAPIALLRALCENICSINY
jgi:hypothetical protein